MIQSLIDAKLKEEQDARAGKVRSGKWSPSSFGYCYRKQYWNRLNEPITNPIDDRTLRVFAVGHIFHKWVEQFFPRAQTEVKVDNKDVFGYADIVLDDEVIDIKTVHSYAFHYTKKGSFDITKEKYSQLLQIACYALLLNKPKFRLVMISKDDLCIEEYGFYTAKWAKEVENELRALRGFWDAKTLPPAFPRAFGGTENYKECRKYCQYLNKCLECGLVLPPEKKKERKGDKNATMPEVYWRNDGENRQEKR